MLNAVGSLTRPPDFVNVLYSCKACRMISGKPICSKCGAETNRVGEAGIWKPHDTQAEIEELKKRLAELESKK
jgi:hypothetical protein